MSIRSFSIALGLAALPVVASAQVLDLGGGGSFSQPIGASNAGRTSGWFYDNLSADKTASATNCNVGFFAVGTMEVGCANQAPGTFANQGGFVGGTGFGSGDGDQPAPFMFSGAYSYNLRLVGSMAGKTSHFGIFTRDEGGSYSFFEIPSFGAKQINSTWSILAGSDWGFYIQNTFNPATGGCLSPQYDCSDAAGGYTSSAFQQFVLMRSGVSPFRYLVGGEDNSLGLLPNGSFFDSDYNDYIVEVTAIVTPEPMSMALMATGLVGLAGAGFIQRRRRNTSV